MLKLSRFSSHVTTRDGGRGRQLQSAYGLLPLTAPPTEHQDIHLN